MIQNKMLGFLLVGCFWVALFGCFDWAKLPDKICDPNADDVCQKTLGKAFYCSAGGVCVRGEVVTEPAREVLVSEEPTSDASPPEPRADEPPQDTAPDAVPDTRPDDVPDRPDLGPKERENATKVPYPSGHPCQTNAPQCSCIPTQLYHVVGQTHPGTVTHSAYFTAPAKMKSGVPDQLPEERVLITADDLGNIKLWKDARLNPGGSNKPGALVTTRFASDASSTGGDPDERELAALLVAGEFKDKDGKQLLSVTKKGLIRIWKIVVNANAEVSGLKLIREIRPGWKSVLRVHSAAWAKEKEYIFLGGSDGNGYSLPYKVGVKSTPMPWPVLQSKPVRAMALHPQYMRDAAVLLTAAGNQIEAWDVGGLLNQTGTKAPKSTNAKVTFSRMATPDVTHLGISSYFATGAKIGAPLPVVAAANDGSWALWALGRKGSTWSFADIRPPKPGLGAPSSIAFPAPPIGITSIDKQEVVLIGHGTGKGAGVLSLHIFPEGVSTYKIKREDSLDALVGKDKVLPEGMSPRALFLEPTLSGSTRSTVYVGQPAGPDVRSFSYKLNEIDKAKSEYEPAYFNDTRYNHSAPDDATLDLSLSAVALSPDKKWLFSGNRNGSMLMINLKQVPTKSVRIGFSSLVGKGGPRVGIVWVAYNLTGEYLAVATADKRLRLTKVDPQWTIATFPNFGNTGNKMAKHKLFENLAPEVELTAAAWHPTIPNVLALGTANGRVEVRRIEASEFPKVEVSLTTNAQRPISSLSFDREGNLFVGIKGDVSSQPSIEVWDWKNKPLKPRFFASVASNNQPLIGAVWYKYWTHEVPFFVFADMQDCDGKKLCGLRFAPETELSKAKPFDFPTDASQTPLTGLLVHPERSWMVALRKGAPNANLTQARGAKIRFWEGEGGTFRIKQELKVPQSFGYHITTRMVWAPGALAVSLEPDPDLIGGDALPAAQRGGRTLVWRCPEVLP